MPSIASSDFMASSVRASSPRSEVRPSTTRATFEWALTRKPLAPVSSSSVASSSKIFVMSSFMLIGTHRRESAGRSTHVAQAERRSVTIEQEPAHLHGVRPQQSMVPFNPGGCILTGEAEQIEILNEVSDPEGGQTGLASPEEFAGPPDTQVEFGDLEAVVGPANGLQGAAALRRWWVRRSGRRHRVFRRDRPDLATGEAGRGQSVRHARPPSRWRWGHPPRLRSPPSPRGRRYLGREIDP